MISPWLWWVYTSPGPSPWRTVYHRQLYFTQLSGHSCYFYIFFKVFVLEGIHWFLLGQASWWEAGSRCQWHPETSKPCHVSCGVPGPGFQNIELIFNLAAWHLFLWWTPLSGRWETWSSRVPGNIKKQKRPRRSMGYVSNLMLATSTNFRCLHSWEPGCTASGEKQEIPRYSG